MKDKLKDLLKALAIGLFQNYMFFRAHEATGVTAHGPFLVIAPHPDDEVLGCGAFTGRARRRGQEVHIAIVMDGETESSNGNLVDLRQREAEQAAKVMGVGIQNLAFLHQPNGNASSHIDAIEQGLAEQIREVQPALILAPYGIDKHPDHRAIAQAIDRLWRKGFITCPIYEYPIWFWLRSGLEHLMDHERMQKLRRVSTDGYIGMKKTAMQAHNSQCPPILGGPAQGLFQPWSFMVQFFDRYEIFFEKS